jgi:RNA polymerase sigma factor for flagellar operon FliA
MPTRRTDPQSTIDGDTTTAVTPAPTRTKRKTRSRVTDDAASGARSASTPTAGTKGVRRATAAAEPKPIRTRTATSRTPVSAVHAESATSASSDEVVDPSVDDAVVEDDAVVDPEDLLVDEIDDIDPDDLAADASIDDDDAEADDEAETPRVKVAVVKDPPLTGLRAVNRGRSREDEAATLKLWQAYKKAPDETLRNRLIERYLHIVNFSAERMHARLPGEVDVDDLKQAGLFGLMDSIDAFDLERGVKFETFCTARVRGAIFDELRSMDWVPRLVRARTSKVDRARKALEAELGRRATDDELCRQLGVDQNEFKKIIKDSSPVSTVSLDRKWFETDSSKDVREIDVIKDTKQESPVLQLQRGDLKHLITRGLSRAERLIVVLYYYEGMTMKEIGTTLDLSESRVSQMHSSILARLKAQMQHRDKEF